MRATVSSRGWESTRCARRPSFVRASRSVTAPFSSSSPGMGANTR